MHVKKGMSWDEDFLGARASRPHKAWHRLGYLSHFDQPGTAPLLPFRLADAVPAHRVAACSVDGQVGDERHLWAVRRTLAENPGQAGSVRSASDWPGGRWHGQDAGGTPAFPGDDVRMRGGGGWWATSQKSDVHQPRSTS